MNLNRLPVLLLPNFIRDAAIHSLDWMVFNYPKAEPTQEDVDRARRMDYLRDQYRTRSFMPSVELGHDPFVAMYSWCLKYLDLFEMRTSYVRFIEMAERLNYEPVLRVENYGEYWKLFFEYIYVATASEFSSRTVHCKESFLAERFDYTVDIYENYKSLLRVHGAEFELGRSSLDKHFLSIWEQFKLTTA